MNKINREYLKRKEIRKTIGFIDIKNPTKPQREEISNDFRIKLEDITKNILITKEVPDFSDVLEIISDDNIIKYLKMLTNIPNELLDDEEIITDPSDDLRLVCNEISEIISPIFQETYNLYMGAFTYELQRAINTDKHSKNNKVDLELQKKKAELLKKQEEIKNQLKELGE